MPEIMANSRLRAALGAHLAQRILFAALCTLARARASDVVMLPVNLYGQPLTGCEVAEFLSWTKDDLNPTDLKDHFRGLTGRDIPWGDYSAVIRCGPLSLSHRFMVSAEHQFEVVPAFTGIIYEGEGPHLLIKAEPNPGGKVVYWVQLLGVYNGLRYATDFDSKTGESTAHAPPSGSYLVEVLSTGGYDCVKEIDLVEQTRRWVFHPANCTFDVDRFAHVVTEKDKLNHRHGAWYQEMQKEEDLFFRELEKGADKP